MTLTSTSTPTTDPPDAATETVAEQAAPSAHTTHHGRRWIEEWNPEDEGFWQATGARIAKRNLVFSVLSEHVGFSIWSMWSVLVLFLGPEYGFTPSQKFLLTTVPVAIGAAIRIPYTFAVARFGGRNFTIVSSALLLVPAAATAVVLRPGISFGVLLAVSALAGIGGGNFSSSMSNIDGFYPQRLKGWALGLNAGGGNIGVAGVQLVGLIVLATAGASHPRLVIATYVPLIVLSTLCAARWMDNLGTATNDKGAMRAVLRIPHSVVILALYVGTFGSFIGFGFAFGQVLLVQFPTTSTAPQRSPGSPSSVRWSDRSSVPWADAWPIVSGAPSSPSVCSSRCSPVPRSCSPPRSSSRCPSSSWASPCCSC